MHKSRIEAFSDAVIAIILTIMVLELKVPHGALLADLLPLRSVALCYLLSFLYLATFWNNHHHLFQAAKDVNGTILWANVHLLFWLSLIPFVTAWAGENHFASTPTALYGFVLLMSASAYFLLTKALIAEHGNRSILATALGKDRKTVVSILLFLLGVTTACWAPLISLAIYASVAVFWVIPDRRIETKLKHADHA